MTQLGELWAEHHADIESQLRDRLKLSRHDAEEIVGDAAVKLLDTANPSKELLFKVSLDRATDVIRVRAKRAKLYEKIEPLFAGQAIPTIEGAMFRADFDRAFRGLPREQAEAFALTELRGLTERETAEVLGVHQSTVNRRCEAARTYLQKELS